MRLRMKVFVSAGVLILGLGAALFVFEVETDPTEDIRNDLTVTVSFGCSYFWDQPSLKPGAVSRYPMNDWPSTMCPVFETKGNRYVGCFDWDGNLGQSPIPIAKWMNTSVKRGAC